MNLRMLRRINQGDEVEAADRTGGFVFAVSASQRSSRRSAYSDMCSRRAVQLNHKTYRVGFASIEAVGVTRKTSI